MIFTSYPHATFIMYIVRNILEKTFHVDCMFLNLIHHKVQNTVPMSMPRGVQSECVRVCVNLSVSLWMCVCMTGSVRMCP